tara:strand:+ start:368 stop:727 length:360 start_codon:yes stop_codon:yes gene_type:complete
MAFKWVGRAFRASKRFWNRGKIREWGEMRHTEREELLKALGVLRDRYALTAIEINTLRERYETGPAGEIHDVPQSNAEVRSILSRFDNAHQKSIAFYAVSLRNHKISLQQIETMLKKLS